MTKQDLQTSMLLKEICRFAWAQKTDGGNPPNLLWARPMHKTSTQTVPGDPE